MPIRDSDIKQLIDTERDTTPFIAAAQLIVTETLVCTGQSQARLDLITKYLAAHFCSLTEEQGGLVRSKQGDTEEDYIPATSYREAPTAFQMSRYGTQAMALDTSGKLAKLQADNGMRASFRLYNQSSDAGWTGDPDTP